jgi:hypothetical protein
MLRAGDHIRHVDERFADDYALVEETEGRNLLGIPARTTDQPADAAAQPSPISRSTSTGAAICGSSGPTG